LAFVSLLGLLWLAEIFLPRSGAEAHPERFSVEEIRDEKGNVQSYEVVTNEEFAKSEFGKIERLEKDFLDIWEKLMVFGAVLLSAWWWKKGGLHKIAPPKHHG